MEIVTVAEVDLTRILQLQKECYLEEAKIYDDYSIRPLLQTLESIKGNFAHHTFLKAIEGERIVRSVRGLKKKILVLSEDLS
jgi:hypothetical protein